MWDTAKKVKFVKTEVPKITIELQSVEGAVVTAKKWMSAQKSRELTDKYEDDPIGGSMAMLEEQITEWNLIDENDQDIPITLETLGQLPQGDIILLITAVTDGMKPPKEVQELIQKALAKKA